MMNIRLWEILGMRFFFCGIQGYLRIHLLTPRVQDIVVTTIDISLEATQGGGSANKSTRVLRLLRRDASPGLAAVAAEAVERGLERGRRVVEQSRDMRSERR